MPRFFAVDLNRPKHKEIDTNVKKDAVVLFMKGTPQQPQCGFSGGAVKILSALGSFGL
jgi:monothiol glutaredoxin